MSGTQLKGATPTDARDERLLRHVLDGLSAFVGVLAPDGTLVEANRAALQAAGLRPEDVLGLPFDETFWWSHSPEEQGRLREAISRVARGEPARFDAVNRVAGDRFVTVDFMLAPLLDERGRVTHLIASGIDITERKRAEGELRLSEERFLKAFRASPDVLVISRMSDGTILEVNDSWSRLFGYTREEVIGKSSLALNLFAEPEDRERVLAALRAEGSVRDYEVKICPRTGEVRDTLLSVETLEVNGELCILTIVRDITEQKRAEERIRQQAALLDVAQDAILVRDLEDRIVYWNRGAERLYGWTAAEAVGRQVEGFIYKESTPQVREARRELLKRGEWSGEVHQVTKDGRDIIVESRWTLVRDERGAPRAKLVVNTDVTEKRKLLAELSRASHLSLIGELAAGLAHEVKNPLAGIKGAVDILILRRKAEDPEVAVLEDVRHAVERIDATVRALLERARPRPPRLVAAPLSEAVHRAVLLARHHAANSEGGRVEIVYEPPPDALVLPIDSAQIEDAVLNLILNAVEATGGGGRVVVNVRREADPDEAVVEVSDTGRGIKAEDLTRVFSPFYTTTEGGTGLGLPSVRRTARTHGGRVEVRSEPGRGSTFAVCLPLPAET